jgi:hypothetical protein
MSIQFKRAKITEKSLNLTNFNRMVDYIGRLANMTSPNILIDRGPGGYVLKALKQSASTVDYTDFAFGYSISGATVTVNAGTIRHGTRPPLVVKSKDIAIAADKTWIFVAYDFGEYDFGDRATITSAMVEPISTGFFYRHVLYLVTLSEGVASIDAGNIKHLGDISIPGAFA